MEPFLAEKLMDWIATLDGTEKALMESRRDEEIIIQPRFGHALALGQMCGLTLHEARSLDHDGELDIPSLIHQFSDIGDRGDLLW
ncbi:hypothetical protein ACSBR1_024425 [Camellia fascicularis]